MMYKLLLIKNSVFKVYLSFLFSSTTWFSYISFPLLLVVESWILWLPASQSLSIILKDLVFVKLLPSVYQLLHILLATIVVISLITF